MFLPGIIVNDDIIDVSSNTIKSRNNLVDRTLKRSRPNGITLYSKRPFGVTKAEISLAFSVKGICHFFAIATRVFDEIKFCEQFLKRNSYRTFLPNFGPKWPCGLGGDV